MLGLEERVDRPLTALPSFKAGLKCDNNMVLGSIRRCGNVLRLIDQLPPPRPKFICRHDVNCPVELPPAQMWGFNATPVPPLQDTKRRGLAIHLRVRSRAVDLTWTPDLYPTPATFRDTPYPRQHSGVLLAP